uniref:Uncharacterized protein n=1 Tax=Mycena chlorophos TaxID=658473 RepID=A0ABQ0KY40_MYCCL|nr:predicted protein [Mycena chlorophos]
MATHHRPEACLDATNTLNHALDGPVGGRRHRIADVPEPSSAAKTSAGCRGRSGGVLGTEEIEVQSMWWVKMAVEGDSSSLSHRSKPPRRALYLRAYDTPFVSLSLYLLSATFNAAEATNTAARMCNNIAECRRTGVTSLAVL